MNTLLNKLPRNAQRGSKPRCHLITHGTRDAVATRLTALGAPFASVASNDQWMPNGFEQIEEAELHKAPGLLSQSVCEVIQTWWFAVYRGGLQTAPSFDIASTCTVDGRRGILLIEAKAYDQELIGEEKGKILRKDPSDGEKTNHARIGQAIQEANSPLSAAIGKPISLSRDNRYQMSNRFATVCKLTELGYPVILVYLGFLNADEMLDRGKPLKTAEDWDRLVRSHSNPLFSSDAWNKKWDLNGQAFIPLIRSMQVKYDHPIPESET